jgi:N-acetylglucosaminyl-diphospho-decaprenol L-rhamnosyltransferase
MSLPSSARRTLEDRTGIAGAPVENGLATVVLSYGRSDRHVELLAALRVEGVTDDQLVLVHNPDGTREGSRPAATSPGVPVLVMDRNRGYGAAMNAGLRFAVGRGAEWVLLLSNDTRFPPGSLAALVEATKRPHAYAVLGPTLVDADARAPFSYGGIDPYPSNIVGHRTDPPEPDEHGIAECAWVDGGVWIIRAEAVRRVGGFDESFWMYFEEPEFCLRVRDAGWKVGVVPASSVHTSPGQTRRPAAYGYLFCRNGLEFAWRAGGMRRLAQAIWSQVRMVSYLAPRPNNRRFYDTKFRRFGYAKTRGMVLGAVAFLLRQWGPPPPRLRRASDIRNTGPSWRGRPARDRHEAR